MIKLEEVNFKYKNGIEKGKSLFYTKIRGEKIWVKYKQSMKKKI